MLTLPIKNKWFDMIRSGEKKEEYREVKPYYDKRLDSKYIWGDRFEVIFRNGYSKNSPSIKCLVEFQKGYGHTMWGAELNKIYYVLKILSVEEFKNGTMD